MLTCARSYVVYALTRIQTHSTSSQYIVTEGPIDIGSRAIEGLSSCMPKANQHSIADPHIVWLPWSALGDNTQPARILKVVVGRYEKLARAYELIMGSLACSNKRSDRLNQQHKPYSVAKVTRIRSNCLDILMMSLREIGKWSVEMI